MQTLYNVQPSEHQTYKMLPFCCGGLFVRIIIQGIDQTSSQNLSKNLSEIEVWRPLEASWRRPGPSWASWASWLAAYRVLAGHLGGLGSLLGRLKGKLGASWAVLGRLLGHLGKSRGVWEAS